SGVQRTGSGGYPAYTWTATGLPAGLSLDSATGMVSGTPTQTGFFSVDVTLTDSQSNQVPPQTFPLTINAAPAITTATLPNGQQGAAYSARPLSASGGTPSLTWSANGLPAGL